MSALAVLAVALTATASRAADWGGITPGTTTKDGVRSLYGEPTTTTNKKLEGYDVSDWVYERGRTPAGVIRMVIEFGLLAGSGFKPDVARTLRVEPAPGVFTRRDVISGWGLPYAAGREGDTPEFYYEEGLLVLFDKEAWNVERLLFTLPQPRQAPPDPAQSAPSQPAQPRPGAPQPPKE